MVHPCYRVLSCCRVRDTECGHTRNGSPPCHPTLREVAHSFDQSSSVSSDRGSFALEDWSLAAPTPTFPTHGMSFLTWSLATPKALRTHVGPNAQVLWLHFSADSKLAS